MQKPSGCFNVLLGDLLYRHLKTVIMEKGQGSAPKWAPYGSELLQM